MLALDSLEQREQRMDKDKVTGSCGQVEVKVKGVEAEQSRGAPQTTPAEIRALQAAPGTRAREGGER